MRYRKIGAPFEARCVGCLLMDLGTRKPTSFLPDCSKR
jgi:hypothetical protein